MKKSLLLLVMYTSTLQAFSQQANSKKNFFRLYEDNDGINFFKEGTDWGYTNGTRLDIFSEKEKKMTGFFSRLATSAGPQSITTAGGGLMQVMISPKKTNPAIPDKNDYSYAGGLFFIYTVHSANAVKKLNVQTEWLAGVMGPSSFAKEAQIFLHRIIKDPRPNGWNYQLPTDLLLNYRLTVEKLVAAKGSIGLIGGGSISGGTLSDGLSCFAILRFQKNAPYFSGLRTQYFSANNRKPGIAISIKPALDVVFYNALLDGGLFNKQSPVNDKNSRYANNLERNIVAGHIDLSLMVSYRDFSIALTQKKISPGYRNYSAHQVGNISLYIGW